MPSRWITAAAGWAANGGTAGNDLIRAKEVAYEIRKLQLRNNWKPEMPGI